MKMDIRKGRKDSDMYVGDEQEVESERQLEL